MYERPNRAYEFGDFTLGFFINLIILFGLTFPWFYRSLFKTRPGKLFTRALLFLTYGFIIFFFISSFNRRIQTQWLIAICIPMLIIAYETLVREEGTRKWLIRMGIANGILLLYLRIGLAYAPVFPIHYESHGNQEWVAQLAEKIGEMPVVFEDSYRLASMYQFYSGNLSYSLNGVGYRHNQYSIDDLENELQHKDVLYVSKYLEGGDIAVETSPDSKLFARYKHDFESFRKLRCLPNYKVGNQNIDEQSFLLYNPYARDVALSKLKFGIAYLNKYRQVKDTIPLNVTAMDSGTAHVKSGDSLRFAFQLPPTDSLVPTYFKLTVSEKKLPFGLNSNNVKIIR
jgi:Ca2+/Na+ antiporter